MTKGGKPAGGNIQQRKPKFIIILALKAAPDSIQYMGLRALSDSWGKYSSIKYNGKVHGQAYLFFFINRAFFEVAKKLYGTDENIIGASGINNVGYVDIDQFRV